MRCPCCGHIIKKDHPEQHRYTVLDLETMIGDELELQDRKIRSDGTHYYPDMWRKYRYIEMLEKIRALKEKIK